MGGMPHSPSDLLWQQRINELPSAYATGQRESTDMRGQAGPVYFNGAGFAAEKDTRIQKGEGFSATTPGKNPDLQPGPDLLQHIEFRPAFTSI